MKCEAVLLLCAALCHATPDRRVLDRVRPCLHGGICRTAPAPPDVSGRSTRYQPFEANRRSQRRVVGGCVVGCALGLGWNRGRTARAAFGPKSTPECAVTPGLRASGRDQSLARHARPRSRLQPGSRAEVPSVQAQRPPSGQFIRFTIHAPCQAAEISSSGRLLQSFGVFPCIASGRVGKDCRERSKS